MRTYTVHLKKRAALRYEAYAYTEDEATGRIFFHKKEDKSDRDSFVMIGDVTGIDEEHPPLSPEEQEEQLRSSPALQEAMRRMLDKVAQPKKSEKKS